MRRVLVLVWIVIQVVAVGSAAADDRARLTADDLEYLGAFRFPAYPDPEDDWAYSGHAIAYYPDGDPSGAQDGFPGSLFAAGHVYDDEVGEISIPAPVISDSFSALAAAEQLQPLADVTDGLLDATCTACASCDCAQWEVDGLLYLANVNRLAWVIRDWYNVGDGGVDLDSLGWSQLQLDPVTASGVWHIGPRGTTGDVFHSAKTANYLLTAPSGFATDHLGGRWMLSGNHRLSGAPGGAQGPSLYAMAPWTDGNPPTAGAELDAIALVYYPWSFSCTENVFTDCLFQLPGGAPGYRVDDDWGGAAWIESGDRAGVLVFGRKGLGDNCYGIADGDQCPTSLCDASYGWHSDPYEPQILFYDPDEIAEVVAGAREPWQVLPYEVYRPTAEVFDADCGRLSGVAYDRQRQLLYVTERAAGEFGMTAVHVWRVVTVATECDADLSGQVTGEDLLVVIDFLFGGATPAGPTDCQADGVTDAGDLARLVRMSS